MLLGSVYVVYSLVHVMKKLHRIQHTSLVLVLYQQVNIWFGVCCVFSSPSTIPAGKYMVWCMLCIL